MSILNEKITRGEFLKKGGRSAFAILLGYWSRSLASSLLLRPNDILVNQLSANRSSRQPPWEISINPNTIIEEEALFFTKALQASVNFTVEIPHGVVGNNDGLAGAAFSAKAQWIKCVNSDNDQCDLPEPSRFYINAFWWKIKDAEPSRNLYLYLHNVNGSPDSLAKGIPSLDLSGIPVGSKINVSASGLKGTYIVRNLIHPGNDDVEAIDFAMAPYADRVLAIQTCGNPTAEQPDNTLVPLNVVIAELMEVKTI